MSLVISHSVFVNVPPATAYSTLTTADGWDAWFTTGAEIDLRPGGLILLRWRDFGATRYTSEIEGRIIEAVTDLKFAFSWYPSDSETTVSFEFTRLGEGTMIRFTEKGYADTPADRKAIIGCAVGWGEALGLLKFYLEHGLTYGQVPWLASRNC